MKIAILGFGHIGTWLARELSRDNEVSVYDIDKSQTNNINYPPVLNGYFELQSFNPDLLINAVSLQNTIEAFKSAAAYLPKKCLICDVASVKGKIPDYYKECEFRYVSIHPMFGPTFANIHQLKDENAIIIKESDPEGSQFFKIFFNFLGVNIFEYSFKQHDQMIAYSLSLPFASTMVFASCMNTTAVPGTTFKKHREIARSLLSENDYLLAEILFNPYTMPQLEKVTGRLEFLKHIIKQKDMEEAKKFFESLRKNI